MENGSDFISGLMPAAAIGEKNEHLYARLDGTNTLVIILIIVVGVVAFLAIAIVVFIGYNGWLKCTCGPNKIAPITGVISTENLPSLEFFSRRSQPHSVNKQFGPGKTNQMWKVM